MGWEVNCEIEIEGDRGALKEEGLAKGRRVDKRRRESEKEEEGGGGKGS